MVLHQVATGGKQMNYQVNNRNGRNGHRDYAVRPLKAAYNSTPAHDNWAATRNAEAALNAYLESL